MKLFALLFLPLFVYATSLDTLVENAKNSHLSLEAIKYKLATLDDEYDMSRNFENPELSLSVSDIQLRDISNRSLEPMQYTALNFKQKIPYFGKRDANSKKVDAQKVQVQMSLQEAKVKLVKVIKSTAFSIWKIEQELQITDKYINLTNQNIDIFSAYSLSDSSSHMGIMNAELTLSQLKIKKSRLLSALKVAYKNINYLTQTDVKTIEVDMSVEKPRHVDYYLAMLNSNKTYQIKEAEVAVANADVKVKELASFVDPVVQVGYYHREKFEDYLSLGVGFNLPIYGNENAKEEIAKKIALSKQSESQDLKNSLSAKISSLYSQFQSAYDIYNILNNESLPKVQHMEELSANSFQNGSELFLYIQMLEKELSLDEQNIEAIFLYHQYLASLEALIGDEK